MWGRAQAGKEERKRKGPLALSPTWIKGATPPNGGKKYSLNKEHEKEISVYLKNHKYAYIYILKKIHGILQIHTIITYAGPWRKSMEPTPSRMSHGTYP